MQWTWILILISIILILVGLIVLWINGLDSKWGVGLTVAGLLLSLIALTAIILGYWKPYATSIDPCLQCAEGQIERQLAAQVTESRAMEASLNQVQACRKIFDNKAAGTSAGPQPAALHVRTSVGVEPSATNLSASSPNPTLKVSSSILDVNPMSPRFSTPMISDLRMSRPM